MRQNQKPVKFISDAELSKVPTKDNGEPLVRIKDFVPELVARAPTYIKDSGKKFVKQAATARAGTAQRLQVAQGLLPCGYRLFLRSAYRSLAVQQKTYQTTFEKTKKIIPSGAWKDLRKR